MFLFFSFSVISLCYHSLTLGKCHILVHDFRGKLTLPLPRFLLVFTKIGIIHKISQCDDSEGLHEYCYILNDDPDEGRGGGYTCQLKFRPFISSQLDFWAICQLSVKRLLLIDLAT